MCLQSIIQRMILTILLAVFVTACGNSSNSSSESSSLNAAESVSKVVLRTDGITFTAPQYVMVSMTGHYALNVPTGVSITSANWTFSDGTTATGAAPIDHQFFNLGLNTVTVNVVDSLGTTMIFTQPLTVVPYNELLYCLSDLAITVPQDADIGSTIQMGVTIPPCLTAINATVQWNYGDGSAPGTTLNTSHSYTTAGDYLVSAVVTYNNSGITGSFPLTQTVTVSAVAPPPPPDPLACPTEGGTRLIVGTNYTQTKTCGVNGNEVDTYHDLITQTCTVQPGESLRWQETSRTKQLVSAGQCTGEACPLPDGALTGVGAISQNLIMVGGIYYLMDGMHMTFTSSQTPAGACTDVSQVRTCANGVLSGSTDYIYLLCHNGCSGFGPDGTVKTGVVTGSITSAHTCTYGETGISDTYTQIADQKCEAGTVTTSNTRQGTLVTAGVCPTYNWVATDIYTECTAACGGLQAQTYRCQDGTGALADNARCTGAAPVVTRLCDANPDSVKRTDVSTTPDSGGSTQMCPKNQIGVITQSRDMTVSTSYACIDHSVKVASTATTYSPWVTESYCRDYVAYRCSQDSLNNTQADGRYDWMIKCAAQVPVIKQFLDEFKGVSGKIGSSEFKLGDKGRVLYPTFMYTSHECKKKESHKYYSEGDDEGRDNKGEYDVEREHAEGNHEHCNRNDGRKHDDSKDCTSTAVWIAPTSPTASCTVPAGIYVAAVCVSSCATPEQQIMVQMETEKRLKYVSFAEAWEQKIPLVGTLQASSTMANKKVRATKVEQWVNEMMDTEHVILEFHMQSGGVLRLTPNHTLLASDATMHEASTFKAGDSLMQLGFIADQIVEIKTTSYFGKVLNVFVQSSDPRQNIVVTNGYLNGTAFFQNEGAQFLNRDVLRTRLIQGVFSK